MASRYDVTRVNLSECGVPDKVLQTDLVPDWSAGEVKTGTTIMAVEYDGGVIIGADSRTTAGSYVANRVCDKLTRVTDKIYCCRSGSAADSQAVADVVAYELSIHQMEIGEQPLVKTAASLFQYTCYNHRNQLSVGIIVAGWDRKLGGQVYTVPLGGMCVRQSCAIGGSGSYYIYGYVDANFKKGMSKDECIAFVTKAISLAILRDGSSGGVVRLANITADGVERQVVGAEELPMWADLT